MNDEGFSFQARARWRGPFCIMKSEDRPYRFPGNGAMDERNDWWRTLVDRFLSASTELIVERLGEANIRSIFLIGSFASGEGSVVLETATPVVLSDFDLAVVFTSYGAYERFYPHRKELGSMCEGLLHDVVFFGHVDVGMYLAESLRVLPARPGVYDFRKHGHLLYGDPQDLAFIPDYAPSEVGGREAVVLIENRIIPHLAAYPEPPPGNEHERYRFLYLISRVYTDLLTAALSFSGHYRPGYLNRCALLDDAGISKEIADLIPREMSGTIKAWTRFKIAPSFKSLHFVFDDSAAGELWEEAAVDMITFWKRAEASLQRSYSRSPAARAAGSLLDGRRERPRCIDCLRRWKGYLDGLPWGRRAALAASLRGMLLYRDPFDIVREHGVLLLDRYVRGLKDAEVPRPRGGFPHGGGGWNEVVSQVVSRWEQFVFG